MFKTVSNICQSTWYQFSNIVMEKVTKDIRTINWRSRLVYGHRRFFNTVRVWYVYFIFPYNWIISWNKNQFSLNLSRFTVNVKKLRIKKHLPGIIFCSIQALCAFNTHIEFLFYIFRVSFAFTNHFVSTF